MLMDNKIHTRLNVSCLLQSTEHTRLALSDIMIHDVANPKVLPPAKLEIQKTHIEDFDQCRPGEKKEGRGQYYQGKLLLLQEHYF